MCHCRTTSGVCEANVGTRPVLQTGDGMEIGNREPFRDGFSASQFETFQFGVRPDGWKLWGTGEPCRYIPNPEEETQQC